MDTSADNRPLYTIATAAELLADVLAVVDAA